MKVPYSGKLIVNLPLLGIELYIIRQGLPSATAAHPEMFAKRLKPFRRRFFNVYNSAFQKTLFLSGHLNIHDIVSSQVLPNMHVVQKIKLRGELEQVQ